MTEGSAPITEARFARYRRSVAIGFAIAFLGLGGSAYLTQEYNGNADAQKATTLAHHARNAAIETCRRTNVIRVDSQLDTHGAEERSQTPRIAITQPILDCERTADTGMAIPLPTDEADQYIKIVADKRQPVVQNSKIIGSRPLRLPPGPQRPVPREPAP